ncbi:MAG: type II secretion system F family protein [Gammaproteobacteria bacterium]|nr:type II secretion system F family protein [Gammaproteobacteria bacterium]
MFRYKALNSDGEYVEGESNVASENEVVSELQRINYVPIKIIAVNQPKTRKLVRGRAKAFDRLQFFENLADYLDSGLSIDKALELEALSQNQSSEMSFLGDLLEQVRQGRPIADAMLEYPEYFPSLYIGVVQVGEQTDSLPESLKLLAELARDLQTFQQKIKSALIYPAILSGVMLLSIIILFGVVIPRFKSMFIGMGMEMEGITAVIVGISDILSGHYQVLLLLLLLGIFLLRYLLRNLRQRRSSAQALLRVPVIGSMIQQYNLYVFSVIMQILTEKRITIIHALEHVGEAIDNIVYKSEIDLMKREISRGKSLKEVLNSALFSPHYIYLVGVGEETGRMAETFAKLARYYYKQLDNRIKAIMTYAEPAIIMLLGLIIGLIVVSMLQAILSINELAV